MNTQHTITISRKLLDDALLDVAFKSAPATLSVRERMNYASGVVERMLAAIDVAMDAPQPAPTPVQHVYPASQVTPIIYPANTPTIANQPDLAALEAAALASRPTAPSPVPASAQAVPADKPAKRRRRTKAELEAAGVVSRPRSAAQPTAPTPQPTLPFVAAPIPPIFAQQQAAPPQAQGPTWAPQSTLPASESMLPHPPQPFGQ